MQTASVVQLVPFEAQTRGIVWAQTDTMQRVEPSVQAEIRSDSQGSYSRRHVTALARLPQAEQAVVAGKILDEKLTADQTEQEVRRRLRRANGSDHRGAVVTHKNYNVGSTRIRISFRQKNVSVDDVLVVLDELRRELRAESSN